MVNFYGLGFRVPMFGFSVCKAWGLGPRLQTLFGFKDAPLGGKEFAVRVLGFKVLRFAGVGVWFMVEG